MSQSAQVQFILHEWIPALENRDLDGVAKLMHKDFRLTTYPKSLGQPEQTREQWLERFAGVFSTLTENKVSRIDLSRTIFAVVKLLSQTTIHSITEAPGKVIIHVRILVLETDPHLPNVVPHLTAYRQYQNRVRGRNDPRINLHRTRRHRRRREPEGQVYRGVHRLQNPTRVFASIHCGNGQEGVVFYVTLMTVKSCVVKVQ